MRKIILIFIFLNSGFSFANDWNAQELKLKALMVKVNSKKEEMDKIIEEKKGTTDKESLHTLMDSLAKTHRTLLEKDSELRELKNYIRFNYPGHGVEIERKYTPLRPADLDKYEAELGIDGKLNRVKQRVHEVYGKDAGPSPSTQQQGGSDDQAIEKEKIDRKDQVAGPSSSEPAATPKNKSIIKTEPEPERIKLSQ